MGANPGREHLRDPLTRLRAACMNDPAPRVTPLASETGIELDAVLYEIGNPGRRLTGENAHRAFATEASPGGERVLGVQRRVVICPDRSRDTALREVTVR